MGAVVRLIRPPIGCSLCPQWRRPDMSSVPQYIAERVRRPAPSNAPVMPGSTPVVAFGDPHTSRVATLGLNPSKVEFLDRDGLMLTGDNRRLETLASLGCADLTSAPDSLVEQVLAGCNGYFRRAVVRDSSVPRAVELHDVSSRIIPLGHPQLSVLDPVFAAEM